MSRLKDMERIVYDPGDYVQCDFCDEVFPEGDTRQGGVMFQSKAICPLCVPKLEADAQRYGETRFIGERCPADKSFREWVLSMRVEWRKENEGLE